MRVLYVLSTTTMSNGSTKAFLSLCLGLKDKGVEPIVVCPNSLGVFRVLKDKGITALCIPNRNSVYPPFESLRDKILYVPRLVSHGVINAMAVAKTKKVCTRYHPDLIHSNGALVDVGFRAAKSLGIPHIYHLREYQDLDFGMDIMPSMDGFKNRILDKSQAICITNAVMKHFSTGSNVNNLRVIYDGVHLKEETAFMCEKDKYFLFVGRLDEAKGFRNAVFAFSKFVEKRKDYKLLVAGTPLSATYFNEIKAYIEANGLTENIEFLGIRNDVDSLMQKASAVIMASRFEGFGLVTAEAMFNGCLVIGHDTGGTKEQFDNGLKMSGEEIGLRYGSVEDLSRLMFEVADSGIEKYLPMIKRGQQVAASLYSIETCVDNVLEYYNDILADKNNHK